MRCSHSRVHDRHTAIEELTAMMRFGTSAAVGGFAVVCWIAAIAMSVAMAAPSTGVP